MTADHETWGGYRPGAGQKPKWNSGRTTVVRVPETLSESVLWYARLIDGQYPSGLEIDTCLSCQLHLESVTDSSSLQGLQEQIAVLQQEKEELDKENNQLAARIGDLHLELEKVRSQNTHESVTVSSDALGLLQEALTLKANAGGAIKEKIRQALALIEVETTS